MLVKLLLSKDEAAAALSVSPHTIQKYLVRNVIQSVKLGALRRIPIVEVERISREGFVSPSPTPSQS